MEVGGRGYRQTEICFRSLASPGAAPVFFCSRSGDVVVVGVALLLPPNADSREWLVFAPPYTSPTPTSNAQINVRGVTSGISTCLLGNGRARKAQKRREAGVNVSRHFLYIERIREK